MLYHDKINVSEGIDANKRSTSESVLFSTISIFFGGGFKIQAAVCNGCNVYYYCVY